MPRRRTSYYDSYSYSGYGKRESQRRIPRPLPYLVVALIAAAGLGYLHFFVFQSLSGKLTNAYTGKPMPGVLVTVSSQPAPQSPTPEAGPITTTQALTNTNPFVIPDETITTTTFTDGSFQFDRLPPRPILEVNLDGYVAQTVNVQGKRTLDLKLTPDHLSGVVTGQDGKPVAGATLFSGPVSTHTGADGRYTLKGMPSDRQLVVKAPGYLSTSLQVGLVLTQDIALQPFFAKAIYVSADSIATPAKLQGLLNLVDNTELNAVVIDVKADNSGQVLYNSTLSEVQQMGTINQIIPDLDGLLATLKSKKIYTIARLPVFWDQAATGAKPEWALKSKKAPGQTWTDAYGKRWANPYSPQVWDYNIAIAEEVAKRGFNEVQFDSLQFPSDGDLEDIDYGPDAAGKKRVDGVDSFLDRAYTRLSPMGVYVAANMFGLTPFVQDDMGVGQHFEDVAARTDYICPTIYPANYGDGFMEYPHPADHPFEIVQGTMKAAVARAANGIARVKPWLQDFSGKVQYDAPKVRSELDAAEQGGAAGWMLWNFGNVYTAGALKGP